MAGKLALEHMPPFGLALVRVTGAAAFFLVLARTRGPAPPISWRARLTIAAVALPGMALNQVLFLSGLRHTTATNASVLVTSIPVFTLLVAAALGKERPSRRALVGVGSALAGVLWLLGADALVVGPETMLGDALIVLNALCYATYLVLAKDLIAGYGSLRIVVIGFSAASLVLLPLGAPALRGVEGVAWELGLLIAYIIVVPTIFTYLANAWALGRASRSMVAIYIYLQPVAAAVLAALFLGEEPSARVAVAALLVFAGIAVVATERRAVEPASRSR